MGRGSARNPLNEYVFPEDIYNHRKMDRIFGLVDKVCFQGHTHIPGVFTESLNFLAPEEIEFQYQLGPERVLINVGSVGQPRNGDPRSSRLHLRWIGHRESEFRGQIVLAKDAANGPFLPIEVVALHAPPP